MSDSQPLVALEGRAVHYNPGQIDALIATAADLFSVSGDPHDVLSTVQRNLAVDARDAYDREQASLMPCTCAAAGAEHRIAEIIVRHRAECIFGEPRQYVWCIAGALETGNLHDYAERWADRQDCPIASQALSREVRTWHDQFTVAITPLPESAPGFRNYEVRAGDERTIVSVLVDQQ